MSLVLDRGGAARSADWIPQKRIELWLEVQDEQVRSQAPGFDGMERAFALVPTTDGGWKKFSLGYAGDVRDHSGVRTDVHTRTLSTDDGIDAAKIQREGVAFGVDTNVGTLYAQRFQDNFRPWPAE